MDREHVKGTVEKAKGTIKDTAGKVTGDKKLQSEGKLDKAWLLQHLWNGAH